MFINKYRSRCAISSIRALKLIHVYILNILKYTECYFILTHRKIVKCKKLICTRSTFNFCLLYRDNPEFTYIVYLLIESGIFNTTNATIFEKS